MVHHCIDYKYSSWKLNGDTDTTFVSAQSWNQAYQLMGHQLECLPASRDPEKLVVSENIYPHLLHSKRANHHGQNVLIKATYRCGCACVYTVSMCQMCLSHLAALASDNSIMHSRGLITTDLAWDNFNLGWTSTEIKAVVLTHRRHLMVIQANTPRGTQPPESHASTRSI